MSPFPAVDPEPPPRPFWRVALVPAAVVAGLALVVVAVLTLPGAFSSSAHRSGPTGWSARVPGEVIAWDASHHDLVAMTPTGKTLHPDVLATGVNSFPKTSLSGFLLQTGPHLFFYLENRHLTPAPSAFPPGVFQAGDIFGFSPFADDDQALVGGGQGVVPTTTGKPPVIINLNNGTRRRMPGAPADQVVGDPVTGGAWVSVAHGLPTGSDLNPQQPDSRIEYRHPGRAPVVLTTAARLRAQDGLSASRLELTPYPSPNGQQIAIDVDAIGTGTPAESIVVLTRTGHFVGTTPVSGSPSILWFEAASRLLIQSSSGVLSTWVPGQRPAAAVHLPRSSSGWGDCLISPRGTDIICAASGPSGIATRWALIRVADGAVVTEPARLLPVDWSP